jgi:hypothetical protein
MMRRPLQQSVRLLVTAGVGILLTAAPAAAQTSGRRALVRQMYGDVALEVLLSAGGAMHVGAADGRRVITIIVLPRDLRRWADSAARVLSARGRVRDQELRWRAIVEEPGVQGGSMSLNRTMTATDTTISLFIADTNFEGIRTVLDPDEARALVNAMRRAADAALPRRGTPPKPPGDSRSSTDLATQAIPHRARLGVLTVELQPGLDLAQRAREIAALEMDPGGVEARQRE